MVRECSSLPQVLVCNSKHLSVFGIVQVGMIDIPQQLLLCSHTKSIHKVATSMAGLEQVAQWNMTCNRGVITDITAAHSTP
jgi:hypothetical protein